MFSFTGLLGLLKKETITKKGVQLCCVAFWKHKQYKAFLALNNKICNT